MGSIEFLGLLDDSFSFGNVTIPSNAHEYIGRFDNFNVLNWCLFSLPIILFFVIIAVIKHRKYGVLNKEYQKKKQEENISKYNLDTKTKKILFALRQFLKAFISFYIIAVVYMGIHEFMHALVGFMFGADMKVAIIPGGAVAITSSALTRTQYLIILLTPITVLGIIPSILVSILYNKKRATNFKNSFIAWFFLCLFSGMIFSASPDIISTYNILTEVPKDAIMQQNDDNMYWYI